LNNNKLTTSGFVSLMDELIENKQRYKLRSLYMQSNHIISDALETLLYRLQMITEESDGNSSEDGKDSEQQCRTVQTEEAPHRIQTLEASLKPQSKFKSALKFLDLRGNYIHNQSTMINLLNEYFTHDFELRFTAEFFLFDQENKRTTSLSFQKMNLCNQVAIRIFRNFSQNATLNLGIQFLDLSYNNIGDEAVRELVFFVKANVELKAVKISYNRLTAIGALYVF